MGAEGIDAQFVRSIDGPCGTTIIEVDSSGQNRIVVIPGANAEMKASEARFDSFKPGSILLAQLESPIDQLVEIFENAKRSGLRTILNPAPAIDLPESLLMNVKAAHRLLERGVAAVVVTLGEVGAIYVDKEKVIFQPAFPVSPIDTTAAGDAFCGAFAAELDRGNSMEVALEYACAAGGLATTKNGAVPSMPSELEIRSYLAAQNN